MALSLTGWLRSFFPARSWSTPFPNSFWGMLRGAPNGRWAEFEPNVVLSDNERAVAVQQYKRRAYLADLQQHLPNQSEAALDDTVCGNVLLKSQVAFGIPWSDDFVESGEWERQVITDAVIELQLITQAMADSIQSRPTLRATIAYYEDKITQHSNDFIRKINELLAVQQQQEIVRWAQSLILRLQDINQRLAAVDEELQNASPQSSTKSTSLVTQPTSARWLPNLFNFLHFMVYSLRRWLCGNSRLAQLLLAIPFMLIELPLMLLAAGADLILSLTPWRKDPALATGYTATIVSIGVGISLYSAALIFAPVIAIVAAVVAYQKTRQRYASLQSFIIATRWEDRSGAVRPGAIEQLIELLKEFGADFQTQSGIPAAEHIATLTQIQQKMTSRPKSESVFNSEVQQVKNIFRQTRASALSLQQQPRSYVSAGINILIGAGLLALAIITIVFPAVLPAWVPVITLLNSSLFSTTALAFATGSVLVMAGGQQVVETEQWNEVFEKSTYQAKLDVPNVRLQSSNASNASHRRKSSADFSHLSRYESGHGNDQGGVYHIEYPEEGSSQRWGSATKSQSGSAKGKRRGSSVGSVTEAKLPNSRRNSVNSANSKLPVGKGANSRRGSVASSNLSGSEKLNLTGYGSEGSDRDNEESPRNPQLSLPQQLPENAFNGVRRGSLGDRLKGVVRGVGNFFMTGLSRSSSPEPRARSGASSRAPSPVQKQQKVIDEFVQRVGLHKGSKAPGVRGDLQREVDRLIIDYPNLEAWRQLAPIRRELGVEVGLLVDLNNLYSSRSPSPADALSGAATPQISPRASNSPDAVGSGSDNSRQLTPPEVAGSERSPELMLGPLASDPSAVGAPASPQSRDEEAEADNEKVYNGVQAYAAEQEAYIASEERRKASRAPSPAESIANPIQQQQLEEAKQVDAAHHLEDLFSEAERIERSMTICMALEQVDFKQAMAGNNLKIKSENLVKWANRYSRIVAKHNQAYQALYQEAQALSLSETEKSNSLLALEQGRQGLAKQQTDWALTFIDAAHNEVMQPILTEVTPIVESGGIISSAKRKSLSENFELAVGGVKEVYGGLASHLRGLEGQGIELLQTLHGAYEKLRPVRNDFKKKNSALEYQQAEIDDDVQVAGEQSPMPANLSGPAPLTRPGTPEASFFSPPPSAAPNSGTFVSPQPTPVSALSALTPLRTPASAHSQLSLISPLTRSASGMFSPIGSTPRLATRRRSEISVQVAQRYEGDGWQSLLLALPILSIYTSRDVKSGPSLPEVKQLQGLLSKYRKHCMLLLKGMKQWPWPAIPDNQQLVAIQSVFVELVDCSNEILKQHSALTPSEQQTDVGKNITANVVGVRDYTIGALDVLLQASMARAKQQTSSSEAAKDRILSPNNLYDLKKEFKQYVEVLGETIVILLQLNKDHNAGKNFPKTQQQAEKLRGELYKKAQWLLDQYASVIPGYLYLKTDSSDSSHATHAGKLALFKLLDDTKDIVEVVTSIPGFTPEQQTELAQYLSKKVEDNIRQAIKEVMPKIKEAMPKVIANKIEENIKKAIEFEEKISEKIIAKEPAEPGKEEKQSQPEAKEAINYDKALEDASKRLTELNAQLAIWPTTQTEWMKNVEEDKQARKERKVQARSRQAQEDKLLEERNQEHLAATGQPDRFKPWVDRVITSSPGPSSRARSASPPKKDQQVDPTVGFRRRSIEGSPPSPVSPTGSPGASPTRPSGVQRRPRHPYPRLQLSPNSADIRATPVGIANSPSFQSSPTQSPKSPKSISVEGPNQLEEDVDQEPHSPDDSGSPPSQGKSLNPKGGGKG